MINISHLFYQYPNTDNDVLKDVSLTISPGTLTLISGPSGSGKSTLLRCINGLVPHFSGGLIAGEIDVFGSNPIQDGTKEMSRKVGMVFQEPETQFVYDIVEDEIAFSLENFGIPRKIMHQQVSTVLKNLGLCHFRQRKIHTLSGGEKQKIAIASALVHHPKVLILDEPTSQLDPIAAANMLDFIASLKSKLGLTILITEHRLERLLPYADLLADLSPDGRLESGSPEEILMHMDQVPPIISIAKQIGVKPLPLKIEDFPNLELHRELNIIQKDPGEINTQTPVISTQNLTVNINMTKILDHIDFRLYEGEIHTLIGKNGAGKTTLLRSMMGLTPYEGRIQIFSHDADELGFRKVIQNLAYLPQNPNDLLFAESVLVEMQITLRNHQIHREISEIQGFLARFGLEEVSERYPRDLSVGERQRTALAAITIHEPEIIFLDEPTRGMDYEAKNTLRDQLIEWRDQKKAILVVTHDVEFAALIADRVTILDKGEILFTGSPKTAFTQFSEFQTQTAALFPETGWFTPDDIPFSK